MKKLLKEENGKLRENVKNPKGLSRKEIKVVVVDDAHCE